MYDLNNASIINYQEGKRNYKISLVLAVQTPVILCNCLACTTVTLIIGGGTMGAMGATAPLNNIL